MNNLWFNNYVRIAPLAIVAAAVLGYSLAGGVWWGIPVVLVFALLYSLVRLKNRAANGGMAESSYAPSLNESYLSVISSDKNPATEAFDRIQRITVPTIIVAAAILAIWRNDVSIAPLPVALIAAALYLPVVTAGTRIIRSLGNETPGSTT